MNEFLMRILIFAMDIKEVFRLKKRVVVWFLKSKSQYDGIFCFYEYRRG